MFIFNGRVEGVRRPSTEPDTRDDSIRSEPANGSPALWMEPAAELGARERRDYEVPSTLRIPVLVHAVQPQRQDAKHSSLL